ncbi:magnesium/cobalt transporter CorA [Candidatus Woesearchaeota archaeon]|nr:magnesium/cobalt transporter CorA [Candidatus Woesearchaeota archaeon]
MLRVFEKRGASGQVKEISLDKISHAGTVWIDAHSPTKQELEEISKKVDIPVSELAEYDDPDERPRVYEKDMYSEIVFAYPLQSHGVRVAPVFVFFFGRQGILTLHRKEVSSTDRIIKYINDHPALMNSSSDFLHYYLDTLTSEYFHIFDSLSESVDRLEANMIRSSQKKAMSTEQIFSIKRILIMFHKSLVANRDVISGIEKGYIKKMTKKETERFRDIYNDTVQLIDVVDMHRDILTGVLETYMTTLSNNMNEVMKKLTAYASLILVPTLISGIYGMNFRYMPELDWRIGYPFALGLMVISVILLYIYFKRKDWM